MRALFLLAVAAAAMSTTVDFASADPISHGKASFYSHGAKTANGERYQPDEMTAAHRTLPFGTRVRVTDLSTTRSVVVRINDRGPFIKGRIIDVSRGAAQQLGMIGRGIADVEVRVVN